MSHEAFMRFCEEKILRGERMLAALMRTLIARDEPELYEHIASFDDGVFMEPLLFARFAAVEPVAMLPQLLFGALPPDARPDALEVQTDDVGLLYLPAIGHFHTSRPRSVMVLEWDRARDEYMLRDDQEKPVTYRFEPLLLVEGTPFELARHQHPLVAPQFIDQDGHRRAVAFDEAPLAHASHVARAFALLRGQEPATYEQIARTTRRLMVFREPKVNSFAAMSAHGNAFFSTRRQDDEVFFLDDIAHQCGHVIFNAITARRGDVLTIDPETRVDAVTGGAEDDRPVYGALHGLFTEYQMCRVLARAEEARVFEGRAAHELLGRFAFIAGKYAQDIVNLDHDIYTDEGRYCFEELRSAGAELRATRSDLWALDMTEQPYAFDYEIFARRNPR